MTLGTDKRLEELLSCRYVCLHPRDTGRLTQYPGRVETGFCAGSGALFAPSGAGVGAGYFGVFFF